MGWGCQRAASIWLPLSIPSRSSVCVVLYDPVSPRRRLPHLASCWTGDFQDYPVAELEWEPSSPSYAHVYGAHNRCAQSRLLPRDLVELPGQALRFSHRVHISHLLSHPLLQCLRLRCRQRPCKSAMVGSQEPRDLACCVVRRAQSCAGFEWRRHRLRRPPARFG